MTRRRFAALFGLGALAMVGGDGAAGADPATLEAELASIASTPGKPLASFSVLAIRGGEVVFQQQWGRRVIGATGLQDKPVTKATMFRVASISKLVTTLGVMRLVEAGKLHLDHDVSDYLGWNLRNPHFPEAKITLRMLLSHTSSLRDDAGYYTFGPGVALRDVLEPGGKHHGDGRMWSNRAAPGTYFTYANLPWGVVGCVMEKVENQRFDVLMRRLVLQPLGMNGGFDPASLPAQRLADVAVLYRKATAGDVQKWNPDGPWIPQADDYSEGPPAPRAGSDYVPGTNATIDAPQGGLRASALDLARVMRMLMDEGRIDGQRFLEPSSIREMSSAQWTWNGSNGQRTYGGREEVFNAWGLGVQHFTGRSGAARGDRLVADGSFRALGHHGDAYGLSSLFAFDPATRDGVIVLVGGTGFDPATDPGTYSWTPRFEERIVDALWRRAIRRR